MNLTPKAPKAEWHLTYRCTLACPCCNRACFLPPQTEDMTLADAEEFCRQAAALDWKPRIILIGGEPTLNPHLEAFIELATEFNPGNVELWSNGFTEESRAVLARVRAAGKAQVIEGTIKGGNVAHNVFDIFQAPCDYGERRTPCGTHASVAWPDCGISVDHDGYTLCCMGGAIDGLLRLGARTKRLADLWDEEFAARQTELLCQRCGQHLGLTGRKVADSTMVRRTLLSPTWAAAAERVLADGMGGSE